MKHTRLLIVILMLATPIVATAQYSQLGKRNQFMLKVEEGYAPFIDNVGAGTTIPASYEMTLFQHAATFDFALGSNISQDWFVGGGMGFYYFFSLNQRLAENRLGASVFADFDFRPIWKGVMGVDYQPVSIKWAPEVGGRLGASVMVDDMSIAPMAEIYGGINWYYRHRLRQMEHNWHSFFATVGISYFQDALYAPIRIGWRW